VKEQEGQFFQAGDRFYLVEYPWWKRWIEYCCYNLLEDPEEEADDFLGSIDNATLLDENGDLLPEQKSGLHYVAVSEKTWQLLLDWFVFFWSHVTSSARFSV